MTTRFFSLPVLLVLCGLSAATLARAANEGAVATRPPPVLQVQVNVPPSWRPMFEDRITEAFVSNLSDVFHRQGFQGEIKEVRSFEEPSPGSCLLTINLTEWRVNQIGNIDCTFTANLQTERATRHLGVFSGMSFRWMSGPGRFGLADSFEQAAEDAIRQLYDGLAKTEMVPGLRRR
jgi:hypothetical protein